MASEEDVLLREVDEDLSRDQTFDRLRKYRVPLIGGAVAVLAGVTGWQVLDSRQEAASASAAQAYAALSFAAEGEVGTDDLRAFAEESDSGYATLAALRAAAALGAEGDLETSRDLYAGIYEDTKASASLRDYARVRAAYLLFDNRPADAAMIASQVDTAAFHPFAEEIMSGAALQAGDYAAARAGFRALAASSTAPVSLKSRADAYAAIADAALNGARIEPAETQQSFIERFGAELNAAGVPTGPSMLPDLPDSGPLMDDEDTSIDQPAGESLAPDAGPSDTEDETQ